MAGTKRPACSSPVPSLTIQVSRTDAERFRRASNALATEMSNSVDDHSSTVPGTSTNTMPPLPLHEMMCKVAAKSGDEEVIRYRDRINGSSLSQKEKSASFLLLHQSEFDDKLRSYYAAFANGSESTLQRDDLISLFRTLLTSITSFCGHNKSQVIVEGRPDKSPTEPPLKKVKREEDTASTKESTHESSNCNSSSKDLQASSFDCSLATLQDEETHQETKEIEGVAAFASDQVLGVGEANSLKEVSPKALVDWCKAKGRGLAPWLDLLVVDNWNSDGGSGAAPLPDKPKSSPPSGEHQPDKPISFNKDHPFEGAAKNSKPAPPIEQPAHDPGGSQPLVSFDFSGSGHPKPLCIEISENNILALRNLVQRTGLMHVPATAMCKRLIKLAKRGSPGTGTFLTLSRDVWMRSITDILGRDAWGQLNTMEREAFTGCFSEIFSCFEGSKPSLRSDEVDMQEFAVGFCIFCAGNKSTKLATGFEVLDDARNNALSEERLSRYLASYLAMLVAMSVLAPASKTNSTGVVGHQQYSEMRSAVESGAKWTLSHFLRNARDPTMGRHSFESFASWYSSGGYEVAPWLELLDLNKLFALIGQAPPGSMPPPRQYPPRTQDKMSSLRRHHSSKKGPPPEILFTFPLSNHQSLIVLKEDATYVRGVVQEIGLLSTNPQELWSDICKTVEKKKLSNTHQGAAYVSIDTFLSCMDEVCPHLQRHVPSNLDRTKSNEILANFFQCFDLDQRDSVALDELMGGLTLLCGGKKSHKLSFAFGVFDSRPGIQHQKKRESIVHSLRGEDLFLFLRSILIVTFSCCRQSLDMSDSDVGRCIADTANMICNDVMRYQWETRRKDRLNFDEFGQWYNEGGFERAPWLELLDLRKWVLQEDPAPARKQEEAVAPVAKSMSPPLSNPEPAIPPPPPEDALDPDLFDAGIMPMDSIDEMDMILMQPSADKDTDLVNLGSPRLGQSFSLSPTPSYHASPRAPQHPPLKFHLSTNDDHGGYTLSLSHRRITHLRRILESSGLHKMEAEPVCNSILSKATKTKNPRLSRDAFDSAIANIISAHPGSRHDEPGLFHLLSGIFAAFERDGSERASAIEVACGFTVLCSGKKSDKLEFAFDVLDKRKRGQLSRDDMTDYLKSFLTVLLNLSFTSSLNDDSNREPTLTTIQGEPCDMSPATISRVIDSGAHWATSMAFDGHIARHGSKKCVSMSFDDFAEWYTTKGYSSIPWLELLDLTKWCFSNH